MATTWQHSESFADTNLKMLDDEYLCDVILAAGNDHKRLKCHKFILASRSPVFHTMFCGAFAESSDVINIPDIEEPILRILVRYLYSGKVDLTADIVMPLIYAANKYDISGLETTCELFLKERIDPNNVCMILDQAIRFDYQGLKQQCLDFIENKSKCVLEADAFVEISKEGLKEVLEMNRMLCSESEVYLACKRWASKRIESTGRQATGEEIWNTLGDEIINLIRFPSMTSEEFTDFVSNDNVLTKEETLSVFQTLIKKRNVTKFKNETRGMTTKPYLLVRSVGVCTGAGMNSRFRCIANGLTFTVSTECEMTGVNMFLPVSEGSAECVIEIVEGSRKIHSQSVQLCHTPGLTHKLVHLDKPIHLIGQQEYSITHTTTGVRLYSCTSSLAQISIHNVTLTLFNLKVETGGVGTSDDGTTICCQQFYGFELSIHAFD
ncbi:BTB/POZ domain-containing protein 6-A-like isoform X3 [Dreissena polymorpha]|uniref:BTB/POZ domain-containing protein 6-A-like isoform X3 n=1 Tax=Dreissena polymorpha TaxID=45954 RepID=UPI0022645810|nr:BTB/POZ domain-containing protein 6-A-like isoform X3 [Dreissena polymorpha]